MNSFSRKAWGPKASRSGAIALVIVPILFAGCGSVEPGKKPIPEVVVADVTQRDVPTYADWIGTAEGFNNASIRPQVKGYLLEIAYQQGTLVEKG